MSKDRVIFWFRQDLRIADNPALSAAAGTEKEVICLYILDDETPGEWAMGGAGCWFLHHALDSLDKDLKGLGSKLVLRAGNATEVLPDFADEISATAVFWNRLYEPYAIKRDKALKACLRERDIEVESSNASLLFEPWTVETKSGGPYRVFSPFWRACMRDCPSPDEPIKAPKSLKTPKQHPRTEKLDDWGLLPTKPDWAKGFAEIWTPGEQGAKDRLAWFLDEAAADYKDKRDRPGVRATSGLSPHLHFGDIGPRQIYHAARAQAEKQDGTAKSIEKFIAELGWREFSHHLLYHFPSLPTDNYQEKFDDFPWRDNDDDLKRWQEGQTGYPMVDAGMRELWQTGWMHNRVRMIVASFLVKHLMIHWRHGETWFWDTLVDADLANNSASWQWVAGSGADAAPYFRIFNPITQGEKFDPDGDYVRRYVPELANLPNKYLFSPWTAPDDVLKEAGVTLGQDYPEPIVDHSAARDRALGGYDDIKKAS
ncbi:deoxyribodipyrimidine photo-lyase [Pyruvatibacter mobilis]|uniref:Deoxyribodipyrimidine photo-lyase n=1 Tax=Pyruvatibacter mobilis TaxID=1712261 RepID=A0A845QBT7_9HYPH|nr:deoxyribodipyrimidine photo-lyase [Pyruvatibacter mobilis]NBG95927.1 deoxyribodipyrimidine photo-lyase [Pyruvatibacter mobilis]QJD75059.1 deoxyribodipyrimidine photo-lyase [Pyruvatibacter mobilis]GGD12414.1 deoxyribodipyrimidine photo-lyase [Pyruvatibacter mobilis]